DQQEWAAKYAGRDPEGFKTFVAKAPVVVPLKDLPNGDDLQDTEDLDQATMQVAKMMDIEAEDIKKYGA
ncbi:MAG TPA: hypothetical protein ENJ30_14125, partial [Desulfobulbaceae bacterium]|nr:hypothetical protein [Desulfobulbaceae bacterium]